jgi:hypothetical protein
MGGWDLRTLFGPVKVDITIPLPQLEDTSGWSTPMWRLVLSWNWDAECSCLRCYLCQYNEFS